ncbi:MAG: hypothetical protein CL770_02995 [Chloroflexi bacterium]|nr:hypothetical protein [Chloroflexota bacterium]|tara:strand:+ start:13190 stop:13882 length:693 start_codon:yes stop_codon:yes gene_type:complete
MENMKLKEFSGESLKYIVSEPDEYIEGKIYPIVILLHGFGASMRDLIGMVSYLNCQPCIYIFPNAPIDLKISYSFDGYAWINPPDQPTDEGLKLLSNSLDILIDEIIEKYNVKENHVVIGGFSQGGMLSYWYGLQHPQKFKGIICLSGKLIFEDKFFQNLKHKITDQRIYIEHGTQDNIISIFDARKARDLLRKNGFENLEYYESEIAHSISDSTYPRLSRWLNNIFESK